MELRTSYLSYVDLVINLHIVIILSLRLVSCKKSKITIRHLELKNLKQYEMLPFLTALNFMKDGIKRQIS